MRDALAAELVKLRRSRLPWVTVIGFTLATVVSGLFTFIAQDPDRARSLGLAGAKAQMAGVTADWPGYLALLGQAVAVGGFLVYGMTVIWVFGREFSDRTVKDLLALPTSRVAVVAAKFAVAAAWSGALAAYAGLLGLAVGAALRLPGWSAGVVGAGIGRMLATAGLTILVVTTLGLAASVGRGYLAAVGALFVLLFVTQILAALGYGHVFPYAVPGVVSGVAGPDQPAVGATGYALVVLVAVLSTTATALYWRNADHDR
jgi:ABC-2 type transport system permease protein